MLTEFKSAPFRFSVTQFVAERKVSMIKGNRLLQLLNFVSKLVKKPHPLVH
ncbi:hypothetical protein K2173_002991 [Erythroxylum novogranatense]|uniref:Uncharacterized protein n=1 Tax=Erythroxylum novogranatense TaxID=1862640 RepID=A0AAV8S8E3_9ROSI|nr:hypothetical protein K2173_002991 [Erythroxylum novogranatense]